MSQELSEEMRAIKALRVSIDQDIKDAAAIRDQIAPGDGGRSMSLAITKLEEAKMWAGKALGERGYVLPAEYRDEA